MAKGRGVAIVLEAAEKRELTALTRKHGAPQALAERARIVLAAADGLNNKEIAAEIGVCAATAGRWRHRFAQRRIDGPAPVWGRASHIWLVISVRPP
jgi:FixJ family two-component response regulator